MISLLADKNKLISKSKSMKQANIVSLCCRILASFMTQRS